MVVIDAPCWSKRGHSRWLIVSTAPHLIHNRVSHQHTAVMHAPTSTPVSSDTPEEAQRRARHHHRNAICSPTPHQMSTREKSVRAAAQAQGEEQPQASSDRTGLDFDVVLGHRFNLVQHRVCSLLHLFIITPPGSFRRRVVAATAATGRER